MKNKKIIQALNKVSPSEQQKEKMLGEVFGRKKKFHFKMVWQFGMVTLCLCSFFIVRNVNQIEKDPILKINEPRGYNVEPNQFCYLKTCYVEVGMANNQNLSFLETVVDNGRKIHVYQGETEEFLVLEWDDSYFLYQKIKN